MPHRRLLMECVLREANRNYRQEDCKLIVVDCHTALVTYLSSLSDLLSSSL